MLLKRLLLWVSVGGYFLVFCKAQTQTDLPQSWTLQACIDYAKLHNISINSLRLSQETSQQNLLQAQAAKYPNLNGSVSQGIESFNIVNNNLNPKLNLSNNVGMTSSMVLYNDGYIKNDVKSKTLSVQSSELSVKQAENNITLNIAQAYLNILMARENIVYLQDLLTTTKAQLAQADNQYKYGSIAKKDYLQFQSQVANDQYNLVNAENGLRTDLVNLKQILQLPSNYDFQIPEATENLAVDQTLKNLQEAVDQAQSTRPEIENGKLGVEIAETELKKIQASTKPTLSAGGSINTVYTDHQGAFFSQWKNNLYQSLGLSLAIPIYNRRVNRTAIEVSKINVEQAKLNLENTQTILNQEVEQAYIAFQNALEQYKAAQVQLDINKQTYDISSAELKLGNINLVALQQQRTLYIQAFQSYLQAKYSAVLGQKIYEFYTGKPIAL